MFGTYTNPSTLERKTSIKFKPAMVYGHSQESPTHMTNKYTLYYQPEQKKITEALTTSSKIYPAIKQGFNISKQFERQTSEKIHPKLQHSKTMNFNLTRGTFSTFMDNHKHYTNLSILHKEPRKSNLPNIQLKFRKSLPSNQTQPSHQNQNTSESIANQKSVADSKNTGFSLRSSSLGLLKTSIRQRRQQFAENSKKQIEVNKRRKVSDFEIGRGENRQLFLLGKERVGEAVPKTQMEDISQQLQLFQKKLFRKFK